MNLKYEYVQNKTDDLHCFQSCFRMVWHALTGSPMGSDEADGVTGFVDGENTWAFEGMLHLAHSGLDVKLFEDFDPEGFAADPRAELMRQLGSAEEVDYEFKTSDVGKQADLVGQCLLEQRIEFVRRAPTIEDLRAEANKVDQAVIAQVNNAPLIGKPGYFGHFVVVKSVDEDTVLLDNPTASIPMNDQTVAIETFVEAWKGLPSIIVVARQPAESS